MTGIKRLTPYKLTYLIELDVNHFAWGALAMDSLANPEWVSRTT